MQSVLLCVPSVMCTWHLPGSTSCHSLLAADRTVEQTNKQTDMLPDRLVSSLIGTSLKFTILSHSSDKFKTQSRTGFTVSSVDTGSYGNATPRELRLRANYMQSENESNYKLPGTIE